MKRIFDFLFSISLLIALFFPMILIAIMIRIDSKGPIIYWSRRIGHKDKVFKMPKFRTMQVDSPVIATHIMENPNLYISSIGGVLRRYSLDEIPQLFSIFKGDMSFVGPRPALFNQDDLIYLRKQKGVNQLIPGLTGWAQINGRDEISITEKVNFDVEYLQQKSFLFDLKIIWKTLVKVILKESVTH
ncbi:sugar transferase [Candidatus Pseudothioglobus sp. Uisw_086]|uniref:sugar transferase n=1 Tax=Candidatus Pseudothioglobus sp. Uisw_086 TaxID=3230998 RepID=UPI003A881D19